MALRRRVGPSFPRWRLRLAWGRPDPARVARRRIPTTRGAGSKGSHQIRRAGRAAVSTDQPAICCARCGGPPRRQEANLSDTRWASATLRACALSSADITLSLASLHALVDGHLAPVTRVDLFPPGGGGSDRPRSLHPADLDVGGIHDDVSNRHGIEQRLCRGRV